MPIWLGSKEPTGPFDKKAYLFTNVMSIHGIKDRNVMVKSGF